VDSWVAIHELAGTHELGATVVGPAAGRVAGRLSRVGDRARWAEVEVQLSLVTAMRSVTGPYRSDNQDSAGCSTEYVFVADGVGGHIGGDVASWTVTHRLMAALAPVPSRELDAEQLRTLVAVANAELRLRSDREPALTGMSTTFTGLFCADGAVRVVHIGDSRAYCVRSGEGRRMTRDDSLVQLLVESGAIRDEDAPLHPQRNVILRSLAGATDDAESITVLSVPAQVGDRWLVCSDGLSDYVGDREILGLLAEGDPESAADALVEAAVAADSHDNVTVAVSEVVEAADAGSSAEPRPYRYLGAAAAPELGPVGDLSHGDQD
jgi:protein phosphatase